MRNPFRTENSAFHFLVLTVVAFAIVAVGSAAGGAIAALVAWIVVSAAALWLYLGRDRVLPEVIDHVGPADERRVVVVAPLAASALHVLANDVDVEQEQARRRASVVVENLGTAHVRAVVAVGEDPITAVDDALHTFGGDEIVVLPGDERLAERLRERYAVPVTQSEG